MSAPPGLSRDPDGSAFIALALSGVVFELASALGLLGASVLGGSFDSIGWHGLLALVASAAVGCAMLVWSFRVIPPWLKARRPPMGARLVAAARWSMGLSVLVGAGVAWLMGSANTAGLSPVLAAYVAVAALAAWPLLAWSCLGVSLLLREISIARR